MRASVEEVKRVWAVKGSCVALSAAIAMSRCWEKGNSKALLKEDGEEKLAENLSSDVRCGC